MHFIPSVDFSIEIFRFIRVKFAFSIYILHNTRDNSQLNIVYDHENKPFAYSIFTKQYMPAEYTLNNSFRRDASNLCRSEVCVEQSPRWASLYVICKTVAVPPTLMN